MKGLTEKQQKFGDAYSSNGGNGTSAAVSAGYKNPAVAAVRMIRNDKVLSYINKLNEKIKSARIANATERQEFWTTVMRGQEELFEDDDGLAHCATKMADRIKASELLGKSQLDFVEQVSVVSELSVKDMTTQELMDRAKELREKREKSD